MGHSVLYKRYFNLAPARALLVRRNDRFEIMKCHLSSGISLI